MANRLTRLFGGRDGVAAGDINTDGTGIRSVGESALLDSEQAIAPDDLAGSAETQFSGTSTEGTGIQDSMLTGERYVMFGHDDGPSTLLEQLGAPAGHPVAEVSLDFHEVNRSSGDDDAPEFEADVIDDVDI